MSARRSSSSNLAQSLSRPPTASFCQVDLASEVNTMCAERVMVCLGRMGINLPWRGS